MNGSFPPPLVVVVGASAVQAGEEPSKKDAASSTMTCGQLQQLAEDYDKNQKTAPIAADERCDPSIFWEADPCDKLIPTAPGFVSDCVYYTRGREVPTLYVIWSALFAIAAAVKRDAWIKWADKQLYTNLYLMIAGPAGAVRKNTAIDLAIDLLDYLDEEVQTVTGEADIAGMKRINPFTSRATPEALVTAMLPESGRSVEFDFTTQQGDAYLDANGKPIRFYPRSEISICQRELITFIGKQNYMDSLIPMMLDLYDCPRQWHYKTQTRGTEELREVMVNFIGGITPAALKLMLPVSATADGFLSRCLVVYQSSSAREFFRPRVPESAPKVPELRERLAWIAGNTFGEWDFTEDAEEWMEHWYHRHKQQLVLDGLFMGIRSRIDAILYRVAALIRWQRYDRSAIDNRIDVQDLVDAERLLHYTFQTAIPIYRMLLDERGGDKSLKTEEYIRRVKRTTRLELIQQAHVPAEDASMAVARLVQEGLIKIFVDGKQTFEPSRNTKEVYQWIESETSDEERTLAIKMKPRSAPVAIRTRRVGS